MFQQTKKQKAFLPQTKKTIIFIEVEPKSKGLLESRQTGPSLLRFK